MASKKNKRSIAARKGWVTRRANEAKAAEERARRSEASKQAWDKRKRAARELEKELEGFLEREILPPKPKLRTPKKTPEKPKPKAPKKKPKKPRKRKPDKQKIRDLNRWIEDFKNRVKLEERLLEEFPETSEWVPMFPYRVKRDGTIALEDVGPLPGTDIPMRQLPYDVLDPILRRAREAMEGEFPIAQMKWLAEQLEIDVRELYALVRSG